MKSRHSRRAEPPAIICYSGLYELIAGTATLEVRRGGVFGPILANFPNTPCGGTAAERFAASVQPC